jgi:hypothetical protein
MKRRNFVITAVLAAGTIKALYDGAKKSFGSKNNLSIFEIGDSKEIIYLKRGSIVKLPENPQPIQSLLYFSLVNYRFGKSPVILSNGHKIEGLSKEHMVVTKEPALKKTHMFLMQYTGEDVGWILST